MTQSESTGFWGRFDIKEFEEDQAELTELLHPVLAAAGVGAWRYNSEQKCFYFDALLRDIYDMPPTGPLSLAEVVDRIHPEDRDAWLSADRQPDTHGVFRSRHRVILTNGQIRWLDWTGKLSPDDNAVLGVCVDVSDEIAAQEKMFVDEKRYQSIALGAPGQFGYMDSNYCVQFMSKDFCEVMGVTQTQVLGQHTRDVFGEEIFESRKDIFDRALSGELVTFEDTVDLGGGEQRFDIVTYKPDLDENGEVQGVFTMRTDISDRQKLEESLRKTSEELTRSNADLEQFAYVASHDLKAPLRSIQVLVEWLLEDLKEFDNEDVHENLGLLAKRTNRLDSLLEDLLNYSRVGRNAEPPESVSLASMVEEIVDTNHPDSPVQVHMSGDDVTLVTDPAALHQVLRNLIGNAIKHHNEDNAEVVLSAAENESHYEVTVADNGPGIPAEFSERIFQMFQTLKPRDEVEGSGMGLAIVERIVRSQGGKVWLESPEKDGGAIFKFTWGKRDEHE